MFWGWYSFAVNTLVLGRVWSHRVRETLKFANSQTSLVLLMARTHTKASCLLRSLYIKSGLPHVSMVAEASHDDISFAARCHM